MTRYRIAGLVIAAFLTRLAGAQSPVSRPGVVVARDAGARMERIADGVFAIIHNDAILSFPDGATDWPHSNVGVVVGDSGVLVIDSDFFPSRAAADIALIRRVSDKPVRFLVNTHWHGDHTHGNAVYTDSFPAITIIGARQNAQWFGSGNAVGRRVEYTDAGRSYSATIVGVVRDARLSGTDTRVRPEIYAPLAQGNPRMLSFVAATQDDPRFFDRRLKQAVWAVAPRLPVEATSDLATLASRSVSEPRFFAASISIFAIAAAILATIGIYGVVSFAVTQRRQEIGIRIALGATGTRITAMIARRAILFGVGGIVIGLGVARGLSHFLEGLLLEVTATDAGVFGAIGTGMMVLAVIAGCVPAWQALRSDPVKAIRMP